MPFQGAFLYLVPPLKGAERRIRILKMEVAEETDLHQEIEQLYNGAPSECTHPISLESEDQDNEARELLLDFLKDPTEATGLPIARRLADVTTKRSGRGLLCIAFGKEGHEHRLVLIRFASGQGIHVTRSSEGASAKLLKSLFMRRSHAYKAACLQDRSLKAGFWDGRAIDKQINSSDTEVSAYWIREFLQAELATTDIQGTRRLASALKKASRSAPPAVKKQVVSSVELIGAVADKTMSAQEFCEHFGFSDETIAAVRSHFFSEEHFLEPFSISSDEMESQLPYRFLSLDNGAILMADATSFGDVFRLAPTKRREDEYEISTEGVIKDQGLGKRKP